MILNSGLSIGAYSPTHASTQYKTFQVCSPEHWRFGTTYTETNMIISQQLREIEESTRHLKEMLVTAKDAVKSAERSVERIEEQLRTIRMKR